MNDHAPREQSSQGRARREEKIRREDGARFSRRPSWTALLGVVVRLDNPPSEKGNQ